MDRNECNSVYKWNNCAVILSYYSGSCGKKCSNVRGFDNALHPKCIGLLTNCIIVFLFFAKKCISSLWKDKFFFFLNLSRAFWKENCSSVNYICLFSHENQKDGNRINSWGSCNAKRKLGRVEISPQMKRICRKEHIKITKEWKKNFK